VIERAGEAVATPQAPAGISQDLIGGLFFAAVGGLGLWLSRDYTVGTAMEMDYGYLPRLLCWLLVAFGLFIAGRGVAKGGPTVDSWPWRPFAVILAAIVVFGLSVERLGLVAAAVLVTLVGSHAEGDVRYGEAAVVALVLAALAGGLFIGLLDLPIPLWPPFGDG
jgi:hypothetical protein